MKPEEMNPKVLEKLDEMQDTVGELELRLLSLINLNFPHQHGVLNLENPIFQPIKKA